MKSDKDILDVDPFLSALEACTRAISSQAEPRSVLKAITEQVAMVTDVEDCSVVMLEEGEMAKVVVSTESPDLKDKTIDIRNYPEILLVMGTGEELVIDDVSKSALLKDVTETLARKNIRSMALLPVSLGGTLLGILVLRFSFKGDPMERAPLQFLKAVANVVVLALRSLRYKDRVITEISEKEQLQRTAQREEQFRQKYQELFHRASDGLIIIDTWGGIESVNKKFEGLMGYSEMEARQLRFTDLVTDEYREKASRFVMEYRRKPALRRVQFSVNTKDNHVRHVLATVEPLSGPGEQALVSLQDITEEKEMERQLRRTKEFLENLIQSSVDAVVACDMRGAILIFNEAAEKISGYKADKIIGKMNIVDFYTPGAAYDVMRKLRSPDYGGRGKLETTHYTILSKDGEEIPLNVSAAIVREDGKEIASVGIFYDLRERMRIEKELRQAQENLLESEKQAALAQLSGAAAHELNQPLTSIMGYSDLLLKRIPESHEGRKAIETISKETVRMAEIIKKIGRISSYHTKDYVGRERIIDIDKSSRASSRYENLFLSLHDCLLEFSIDKSGNIGECVFANPSAVRLFGLGNAYKLLGNKLEDLLVNPGSVELLSREIGRKGFFLAEILDAKRTDGAQLYIEATGNLLVGEGTGDVVELMARDVTSRVRMERELRRLKEFNENIVNNAPVGITVVDSAGAITSVNDCALDIIGVDNRDDLTGKSLFDLPVSESFDIGKTIRKGLKGKRISIPDMDYASMTGKRLNLRVEGMPLFDADKNIIGGVIIFQDISDEKRVRLELEAINKIAMAAAKGSGPKHLHRVLRGQLRRILEFDVLSMVRRRGDEESLELEMIVLARGDTGLRRAGSFDGTGTATEEIMTRRVARKLDDLSKIKNLKADDNAVKKSGIRSVMNVPLVVRDKRLGTLNMGSLNPGVYTDRDLEFFKHVADEFAVAMENATLVEELTRKNVELLQKSLYFETLLKVDQGFRVTMNETEVVNRFVSDIENLFPSPHLLVSLISRDRGELVPIYARQLPQKALRKIGPVAERARQLARKGKDFAYYPSLSSVRKYEPMLPGAKSALIIPLQLAGELIGVLQAESHHRKPFSGEDIELLVLMAHQMCSKLGNVRLFEQTRQLERRQDAIIENASALICAADAGGKMTIFNRALEEFTGRSRNEIIGAPIPDSFAKILPQDQLKKLLGYIKQDKPFKNLALNFISSEGKTAKALCNLTIQRDFRGDVQQYIFVGSDITGQEMLERQLVQAAKMAGLGRMAAGVAHELSNPVTYISTFAQLMQKDWQKRLAGKKTLKISKKDLEPLQKIMRGVERIETLISNLMNYSRLDEGELETFDVNSVLKDALSFTEYEFKRGRIEIRREFEKVPAVMGVKSQLQQVFINLLTNASQALRQNGGGVITLRSELVDRMVRIDVMDNGPGIPEKDIRKIFEPFFTTKPEGDGTGLGLSIVQDIINKHGGEITVKSKKNKGTTFSIILPLAPSVYEGQGI